MLEDICLRANRYDDALAAADDGLTTAARTGDHYWDCELHRLKGEIVVATGGSLDEAEQHFRNALADANTRSAKSLELRAAMSLARLWISQGRLQDARAILRPIYSWFSEGLHTADLVAARALLGDNSQSGISLTTQKPGAKV